MFVSMRLLCLDLSPESCACSFLFLFDAVDEGVQRQFHPWSIEFVSVHLFLLAVGPPAFVAVLALVARPGVHAAAHLAFGVQEVAVVTPPAGVGLPELACFFAESHGFWIAFLFHGQ